MNETHIEAMDMAEALLDEGDELAEEGKDEEALARFNAAWNALPEPREACELAVAVLGAIADSHFHLGRWNECREAAQNAFRAGAELDNPFLRLRLGQSYFELGDLAEAKNWLAPAYLQNGPPLFEDEDPKYLASFRGELEPPPDGWPEGW